MPQEHEMGRCMGRMGGGMVAEAWYGTNKNRQMVTEGGAYELSVECIQWLFKSNSADLDPTQQSHYAA